MSASHRSDAADDVVVACYTFPHFHRSAFNDRVFGPGWTEYQLARGGRPWFPQHVQPRVPYLGELDESDPRTWDVYVDLAANAGIDAFIFDWYWYDGAPVFHEALEHGLLESRQRHRMKFAVMWTNHAWQNVMPTVDVPLTGAEPEMATLFNAGRALHEPLAQAPRSAEECWRSLSYVVARYFHDDQYLRIGGKPVLVVWDIAQLAEILGGHPAVADFFHELRAFAGRLGHDGIHIHTPDHHSAANLVDAGVDSYGAYNTLYYSSYDHPDDVELLDYETAYRHVVDVFWDRLDEQSPLPFFPSVSPGWDTTPRSVEPERGSHPSRRAWPGTPIVVGDSPRLFEQFARAGIERARQADVGPRVVTIACWNEWTEGQYLLPDTRLGYGMLRALERAVRDGR